MDRISVDKCPACLQLDIACAEAMGWKRSEELEQWVTPEGITIDFPWTLAEPKDSHFVHEFSFSESLDAAWKLVEYLEAGRGLWFELCRVISHDDAIFWQATFYSSGHCYNGCADAAVLAICRAFLKARHVAEIGEEVDKVCATCRWLQRIEDCYDESHPSGYGRRVLLDCGRHFPPKVGGTWEDVRDVPLMETVVERESNPGMSEDDCYAQVFGCNFWEAKLPESEEA